MADSIVCCPLIITTTVSGGVTITNPVNLTTTGTAGAGALHSISGINLLLGAVNISIFGATINVDQDGRSGHTTADVTYLQNDFSLTVGKAAPTTGGLVGGGALTKIGTGHLILPIQSNIASLTINAA